MERLLWLIMRFAIELFVSGRRFLSFFFTSCSSHCLNSREDAVKIGKVVCLAVPFDLYSSLQERSTGNDMNIYPEEKHTRGAA